MKTETAIQLAKGRSAKPSQGREKLADLLGVTSKATYRWPAELPEKYEKLLRRLRPKWFREDVASSVPSNERDVSDGQR